MRDHFVCALFSTSSYHQEGAYSLGLSFCSMELGGGCSWNREGQGRFTKLNVLHYTTLHYVHCRTTHYKPGIQLNSIPHQSLTLLQMWRHFLVKCLAFRVYYLLILLLNRSLFLFVFVFVFAVVVDRCTSWHSLVCLRCTNNTLEFVCWVQFKI